jgi:hypothetical protein
MEQLVIILLIALISIINWIIQKSKERREKRKLEKRADATGEPVAKHEPAPEATGTETAMRRLREALGLPDEAPPPVIPRRAEPKRMEGERIEPKRVERKKRIERPVSPPLPSPDRLAPPPLPQAERRPAVVHVPPVRWEHRRFELPHLELRKFDLPHRLAKPTAEVEVPRPPSRVRGLLGSPGGLRDAVVLSEILGPPKGLREGGFR